ncbi:MAG TPA: amylo-alpha-1,6-glucosidase [Candidatus Tumulicola sp.]|jgi:predicted glycogen debranching enzyme
MTVEFGRALCGDLGQGERREWLVTNGLGGFASGTIAGTLTRRYHGLLVAALRPPAQRTLLVAKFDETVRYRGASYALASNRWRSGYISPQGFVTIERFYLDATTPVWEFAVADALLERRIWMEPGANATYVRYRSLRATEPLELSLRALVNYRDFHGNTHAGDWEVGVTKERSRALRISTGPDARPFWVVADAGDVTVENVWYRDFILADETARGLDDRDDNLAAGTFVASLQPGGVLTVAARDADPGDFSSDAAYERRTRHEAAVLAAYDRVTDANRPQWLRRGALAADQFVVARPIATDSGALTVIAGYHWFGDWGRDTMIALPGLTLTTGRPEIARKILTTFSSFIDGGMLPNFFPDRDETPQYNAVDAALWFVEAAARYVHASGDVATLRALWPSLQSVVAHYRTGTRYGIHMDTDGLIVADAPGVQLTWMDAKVGDLVITPRAGKPIEVAALWYNALCRMQTLAAAIASADAAEYAALAAAARAGFDRFWNEDAGFCYDVLDGPSGNDLTLRPNQLFAVSLPHSPLNAQRQRAVVDVCAARLVTSSGLRSLDSQDAAFVAHYGGAPSARDAAYHQGTVWTWLLGPFSIAHARVYRDADVARSFLLPLAKLYFDAGLGTLGEIADGSPPFDARGAIAQAWSVAEFLRAWHEIPSAALGTGFEPALRQ